VATFGLVLAAAGSSTRFGGETSKVLLDLGGAPVIAHAARAFREALGPLPTVVAARAEDVLALRALCREEPSLAGAVVVVGGATRQESVGIGVSALPPGVDVVLVHDAARPLAPPALVRRVAEAAERDGAAVPVVAVSDSVHRVDARGVVVESFDRSALRAAQTPQGARAALLRRALAHAERTGTASTDEAALLVAAGIPVTAVEGDARNLKVTVAEDLDRALAALLKG
jgi:2-C-methyl-D-erythritol 4-phosphate cytidylyltransferase